jgi:hypothetical protein
LYVLGPSTTGQAQAQASIKFWLPNGNKLPPITAMLAMPKYMGISPMLSPNITSQFSSKLFSVL